MLRGEETEAVFRSCVFQFNSNTNSGGGAIRTLEGVTLFAFDCTFQSNTALLDGGAVFAGTRDGIFRGRVLMDGCTFTDNASLEGYNGGALGTAHLFVVSLRNSIFTDNRNNPSDGSSGAVDIEDSMAEVIGCQFLRNEGSYGGALAIFNRKEANPYKEEAVMMTLIFSAVALVDVPSRTKTG